MTTDDKSDTRHDNDCLECVDSVDVLDRPAGGMRQVWMLAISLSILQIGFGIVTPIFPFYIVELNATATDLGILAASFALTRIVLAGPMGRLSDSLGRKPVMIGSLLGFSVSNVIYAFAPTVLVMIVARSLEGAISAGFYPSANAFVSDVTTCENRGEAMGYLSMGNMVGFVVGPTVGGVLAEFLGIRLPFIVAAVSALGTTLAVQVLVSEPECTVETRNERANVSVVEVFNQQRSSYSVLALSMFANMFALGILEVAFMLDAVTRYGFSPLDIGVFFGILGVVTIVGNAVFGKISDRISRKWLVASGALLGALSLAMFMVATDKIGFYFAGVLLGLAISMRGPSIQALIADLTDDRAYGVVMGAFGAVSNSAYVVGPLLGGVLYDTSGDAMSSLALAVAVSLSGAVTAGIGLPSKEVVKSIAADVTQREV